VDIASLARPPGIPLKRKWLSTLRFDSCPLFLVLRSSLASRLRFARALGSVVPRSFRGFAAGGSPLRRARRHSRRPDKPRM